MSSKRVLITGASRGIGRAIAVELAGDGFDVVVNYRSNADAANEAKAMIEAVGGTCSLLAFDVGDRAAAVAAIEADIAENGAYYGVVCNAGICRDAPFPMLEDDDWDSVIHTNLDSFYNVLKPAVMPMIRARQGGRIVTMASVSGLIGNRGQTNYAASKAGVIAATKSLAEELAKRKITANCVAPGLIETEMIAGAPVEEIVKAIPVKRLGQADEVAALVGFLFSDRAAYITKQVIAVNGGIC
jgi:3-oxoacyl-[acyl-carrier protein] reductase